MKQKITLLALLVLSLGYIRGQDLDEKYKGDVATLDSTMAALYDVISGEKGEARNWERFHYLFKPGAKLIPTGQKKDGTYGLRFMTPEEYQERSGPFLVDQGFYEVELHRTANTYNNITQVFSTYESYHSKKDTEPFMRGINSIQLLNDGTRWWIVNIYWSQETEAHPIPTQYLPKG